MSTSGIASGDTYIHLPGLMLQSNTFPYWRQGKTVDPHVAHSSSLPDMSPAWLMAQCKQSRSLVPSSAAFLPVPRHLQPAQASWELQPASPTWHSCTPGSRPQCRWGLRWSQRCRCPSPGTRSWPGGRRHPSHCTLTEPLHAGSCIRAVLETTSAHHGRLELLLLVHPPTPHSIQLMLRVLEGQSGQIGAVKQSCQGVWTAQERQSQTEGQRPSHTWHGLAVLDSIATADCQVVACL